MKESPRLQFLFEECQVQITLLVSAHMPDGLVVLQLGQSAGWLLC